MVCMLVAGLLTVLGGTSCAWSGMCGGDEALIQQQAIALYGQYGASYGADTHRADVRLMRGDALRQQFRQYFPTKDSRLAEEIEKKTGKEGLYWLVCIHRRQLATGGSMVAVYDAQTRELLICRRGR